MSYSLAAGTDALQTTGTRAATNLSCHSWWMKNPIVTGTVTKCVVSHDFEPEISLNANPFNFGTTPTAADLFFERSFATTDASGQWRPSVTWTAWNHFFIRYDGNNATARAELFVNGVAATIIYRQGGSPTPDNTARKLTLGNNALKNAGATGLYAEYVEWDVGVTEAQIAAIAAGRYPLLVAPRPLRYWPLKANGALTDLIASEALTTTAGATWSSDHPTIDDPANVDNTTEAAFAGYFDPGLVPRGWF